MTPISNLLIHVAPHEHHNDSHPTSQEPIPQPSPEATPGAPSEHTALHQARQQIGRYELVPALQGPDALTRDNLRGLRLVPRLEHLGDAGLDSVLRVEGFAFYPRGEYRVEPHGRLARVGRCVQVHLLGQGVGERAERCFGGTVGRVANEAVERKERSRENQVARGRRRRRAQLGIGETTRSVRSDGARPLSRRSEPAC